MKNNILIFLFLCFSVPVLANDIYITQSGNNLNLDIVQDGQNNVAGTSSTGISLTGNSMTFNIDQIGNNNVVSTVINGVSYTGNIDLTGSKIKDENLENDLSTKIKNQLKNINQIKSSPMKNISSQSSKTEITNFQDLINIANKEKEVELKYDLERNVKLVSFNKGKIDISFNEDLNKNFIKNLTEKLLLWTGDRWIISLSKNIEAKSVYEKNIEKKSSKLVEFKKSELAKQMEEAFPDAKLEDIQEKNND